MLASPHALSHSSTGFFSKDEASSLFEVAKGDRAVSARQVDIADGSVSWFLCGS
jgi:hypothetical protein